MLSEEEKQAMKYFYKLRKSIDASNLLFDEDIDVKCGKEIIKQITTILNLIEKQSKKIDKLKEIVDECIPKKENIITRELEYTPNANANSYLTQEILLLLKEE